MSLVAHTNDKVKDATVNGMPQSTEVVQSGDSVWVWVRDLTGTSGSIRVEC